MITIRLYPPSLNPVKDDAPGWLACSQDAGQPISRNGTSADEALDKLTEALGLL